MRLTPQNVRTRLTLWYVLLLAVILLAYAGITMGLVFLKFRNDLDRQLAQDYEIIEDLIAVQPDGSIRIDSEDDPFFQERWLEIWSPDWQVVYESRPFSGQSLPALSNSDKAANGFRFRSLRLDNGARVRVMLGKMNIEGKRLFIRIIRSEDGLWQELAKLAMLMLIALPLALVIAGFGGYIFVKRLLVPVGRMATKARKISSENLQERLPVINADDEFGNLARAFNELLERLQIAFERLKQFTSDAAHELRTPLTAIRSIGEVGLQDQKAPGHYREVIGSILEENQRLTHLVDSLLFLSRADSKAFPIQMESLPLQDFIAEIVEIMLPLAEEKKQTLTIQADGATMAMADRALLRQALLNLLDNAIKYSPEKSEVVIRVAAANAGDAVIEVIDHGPGIAPEHREKIFTRFYRVDKGRSREMGGSGLGLAIAKWAVQAMGGSIRVESEIGKGSSFKILLSANQQ